MKFEKRFKIEKIVSADGSRTAICQANLNVEKKRIEATNGHALACVPCTLDEGDTKGGISVDAIKGARKATGRGSDVSLLVNGEIKLPGGVTMPRYENGDFPAIEQVIASGENCFRIALNAHLLADLQDALGGDALVLFIPKDALDPIRVELTEGRALSNDQPFGVIMPCGGGDKITRDEKTKGGK